MKNQEHREREREREVYGAAKESEEMYEDGAGKVLVS